MTESKASQSKSRLFVLDLSDGSILSLNLDGTDRKVIVKNCRLPDGIGVDVENNHIYWTNMGVPNLNDGSIERVDLDGKNRTTIIPEGNTFTPKQLCLDKVNHKIYWCDREGMRVMRSNFDGSNMEILVEAGRTELDRRDERNWCVGIAVDLDRNQFYWTQKGSDDAGQGRLFRADIQFPQGETAANRADIELLYDNLPEPIDLELDLNNRMIYWTDRGDPPRGNTVNRAPMDAPLNKRENPTILLTHLMEGIGISLDLNNKRMFLTDLGGSIYSANLDGSDKKVILYAQGNLSGVACVELANK
jgi:DNA-binding beta-propeller fold protein YncE